MEGEGHARQCEPLLPTPSPSDPASGCLLTPRALAVVVEQNDEIGELLFAESRAWDIMAELLGPDFILAGSEAMRGSFNAQADQGFHSDRGMGDGGSNKAELDYTRVKMMVYTVPTTAEHGALRVIPASHRAPLHGQRRAAPPQAQAPSHDPRHHIDRRNQEGSLPMTLFCR